MPAFCLRLPARFAFEVRVGQVVERHRRLQVEQAHGPLEQVRLDRLAMLHQRVRGAVELHRADGLEVHAEQLPQAAAVLQPAVRRALRGRKGQTPDEGADRRRAQGAVDAQRGQQRRQAQLLERPQADLLHTDAAGADQAQRVDVHRLHVCRSGGRSARAADYQLRGDPLRFLVYGGRAIGYQRRLARQGVGDAGAQQRPVCLGNVEVAPEVEQGALAHGAAEAFGVHEAMREVGLTRIGPAGLGAPNEHGATIARPTCTAQGVRYDYGTTSRPDETRSFGINKLRAGNPRIAAQIRKMTDQLGKDGLVLRRIDHRATVRRSRFRSGRSRLWYLRPRAEQALRGVAGRGVSRRLGGCDGNALYLRVDPSVARRWVQRLVVRGRCRALGCGSYAVVSTVETVEGRVPALSDARPSPAVIRNVR